MQTFDSDISTIYNFIFQTTTIIPTHVSNQGLTKISFINVNKRQEIQIFEQFGVETVLFYFQETKPKIITFNSVQYSVGYFITHYTN